MKAGIKTVLRTAAWSASGLLMLGAVAGTATAATHHNKAQVGAEPTEAGGPPASRPKLLHEIATVEATDGTFEEYASQFGDVAAVGATSIKVVSDDKYAATYAIDDDTVVLKNGKKATVEDVAVGDKVFLRAEESGGTFTADVIGDGKPPAGHRGGPGHGPGGPDGFGGPGGPAGPPPGAPTGGSDS
jgi:hypothetical protein